jgi:UDP-GlcNAc:undecaprenyl-phosphate GlcNAc-1-phosphate transferase
MQPFLYSAGVSAVLCFLMIVLYEKMGIHDDLRNGERHIHKKNISRFGGVAMVMAFIVSLYINEALVFDRAVWTMIIGCGAILLFGVLDDLRSVSWKSQLFFQIALVLMTFICGVHIEYIANPFGGVMWLVFNGIPVLSIIFMIGWMLFIMNAINWCDGIDGLSGGVVCIAAITLFIIALQPQVMQPPIAIIAIMLAGSVCGFLIFNFPPAKIFAGSSGAFFMGYIISVLAIVAGAKIGATLLVLAVPLLDALWVVGSRIRRGKTIFHGDKDHLHHKLLDRGWSVKKVLFLYYAITILCSVVAVMTQSINKVLMFFFLSMGIILFFMILSYERRGETFA